MRVRTKPDYNGQIDKNIKIILNIMTKNFAITSKIHSDGDKIFCFGIDKNGFGLKRTLTITIS